MDVSVHSAGPLATASFLTGMASDPIRCMRGMGLSLPSSVLMQMGLARGRSRQLLYVTGGSNVRPLFADTTNFRPVSFPPRLRGGGAQARLRRGLLVASDPEHGHYRASFTAQTGQSMMAEFSAGIAKHVDEILCKLPEDEAVDLVDLISDLVRHYSLVTMFKDEDPEAAIAIGKNITAWIDLAYTKSNILLPLNIPGLPHWRYRRFAEVLEDQILKWASLRRGNNAKRDLMSMFVSGPDEDGLPMSDDRLAGHLVMLYEASFTTSASSLIWAFFILMQHPVVAHQLCEELEGSGIDPISDGMNVLELPLLDRVVKESMRLFTTVPYLVRRVSANVQQGEIDLRPGDFAIIGAWATNRLGSHYSEADKFIPDRWIKMNPSAYDYLMFGAGPRRCVGYGLAMIMIKITLASILLRRHPTLIPGTRIDTKVAVTLRPTKAIPVKLPNRNAKFARANVYGTAPGLYTL
jgi:cytochrome P450